VKSIVQLYERCSGSRSIQEEGKQDVESAMEGKRSPRQTNFQASPKHDRILVLELAPAPPKHGVLVDVVEKSPAPPPESKASSDSSTKDVRGVKRKSSSVKEIVQAVENASCTIAASIDRIHAAISQIAGDRIKAQEVLFHTEYNHLKKRDRVVLRNQRNLISAINGLTEIITTGINKSARAGDASKEIVEGGDAD